MDITFISEIPDESFDYVAWLSFIFALLSFIISIKVGAKTNKQNLNAIYFNNIFDEFLIEKIPESLEKVKHVNNKFIVENDMLDDIMTDLLRKIIFFKYKNKKFYIKLKFKIWEIDDFLANNYCVTCSVTEFNKIKDTLEKKVTKLYEVIEKEYCK